MLCKHVKTRSPEELRTIFSLNNSDNDPVTLSLSEVCVIILIFRWNNCNCNKWVAVCAWMCVSSSVTFGIAVKTCYFFRESRESCQTPLEKPSNLKLVALAGTVWTLWNTIRTYSYLLGPPCSFSICYTWRYYIHCGKKTSWETRITSCNSRRSMSGVNWQAWRCPCMIRSLDQRVKLLLYPIYLFPPLL